MLSTNTKKSGVNKGRKTKVSGFVTMNISDVKPWEHFDHIVMNLPASAIEFLGMSHPNFLSFSWLCMDNLTFESSLIESGY